MFLNKKILFLLPLVAITGCTTTGSQQILTISEPNEPAFQRGKYYKSDEGFYISNLTPAPVMALGCDTPINTADFAAPRSEDGDMFITEVDVECEGS